MVNLSLPLPPHTEKTADLLAAKCVHVGGGVWEFTTEKKTENEALPVAFIAALKAKHVKDGKAYSPNLERAKVVFDLMEAGQTVNMVVRNCGQKGFGEAMARIDIAAWRLYKQSQQTPIAKPPISGEGKAPRNFIIL